MKMEKNKNGFATNAGGVIKAVKKVRKASPSAVKVKGGDLRDGKKSK